MTRARVWVEDWQMQCCGEPFSVGDDVAWTVGAIAAAGISPAFDGRAELVADWVEDHHDVATQQRRLHGRVSSTRAVFCRWVPDTGSVPRLLVPEAGSGFAAAVDEADGWEVAPDGCGFMGYLVDLAVAAGAD